MNEYDYVPALGVFFGILSIMANYIGNTALAIILDFLMMLVIGYYLRMTVEKSREGN